MLFWGQFSRVMHVLHAVHQILNDFKMTARMYCDQKISLFIYSKSKFKSIWLPFYIMWLEKWVCYLEVETPFCGILSRSLKNMLPSLALTCNIHVLSSSCPQVKVLIDFFSTSMKLFQVTCRLATTYTSQRKHSW